MNLNGLSGIYQIRNTKNDKKYIGSAKDLYTRKYVHFSLLNAGKHHSRHFQNAYNKESDKSVFVFEVIEIVNEPELLIDRELYYLNTLGKADEYLSGVSSDFLELTYNIKPTSIRGFVGTHSKETRRKLSYANPYQKSIFVFDSMGNLVEQCRNASIASKTVNASKSAVLNNCHDKKFVLKSGFLVCFEDDLHILLEFIKCSEIPIKIEPWNKGKNLKSGNYPQKTKIKVINVITSEEAEYDSQIDFAEEINATVSNICSIVKSGKIFRKKYKIVKI